MRKVQICLLCLLIFSTNKIFTKSIHNSYLSPIPIITKKEINSIKIFYDNLTNDQKYFIKTNFFSDILSKDSLPTFLMHTKIHCINTLLITNWVLSYTNKTQEEKQMILLGALFHDIGKAYIPNLIMKNIKFSKVTHINYSEEVFKRITKKKPKIFNENEKRILKTCQKFHHIVFDNLYPNNEIITDIPDYLYYLSFADELASTVRKKQNTSELISKFFKFFFNFLKNKHSEKEIYITLSHLNFWILRQFNHSSFLINKKIQEELNFLWKLFIDSSPIENTSNIKNSA